MTAAEYPSEISEWAEVIAAQLAADLVDGAPAEVIAAELHAATIEAPIAYQVLVTLSRTVALVLRPTGHEGGPIHGGLYGDHELPERHAIVRASQLIGFAAQGDAGMVDAIARAVLAAPGDPLLDARTTLWAILEVLATEPVTPEPKDQP